MRAENRGLSNSRHSVIYAVQKLGGLRADSALLVSCQNIVLGLLQQAGSTHTTGVGTFVYAAPEQLEGSRYDSKSDMYSVGVIAVELFQPFGTEMERVHRLGELRQGNVPETLSQKWPVLANYIQLLTSQDPSERPSATQLLESELFSTKDKVIHSLLRKIDEQSEEINQLRRQISRMQSSENNVQQTEKTELSPACLPPS